MPPPTPAPVRPPTGSLRTMPETLYTWRIFRIKTGPAKLVATVKAPDAKTAVRWASVKLRLSDRQNVRRMAAFRLYPAFAAAPSPRAGDCTYIAHGPKAD